MFDRTIVLPGRTRTEYVTREVHEHRAPTDESVALLRELEQAAKEKVIASIAVPNCAIPCEVQWVEDYLRGSRRLRAIFSVNGEKMHEEVECREHHDPRDRLQTLVKQVADAIARTILGPAISSTVAERLFRHG